MHNEMISIHEMVCKVYRVYALAAVKHQLHNLQHNLRPVKLDLYLVSHQPLT